MGAEPLREQIAVAILDRLSAISVESGAWATPATVTRALLPIDQYHAFPVLGLVRSSGSLYEVAHEPEGDTHSLRLDVWGYVKGDAAVLASTKLERLWEDVRVALLGDSTLAGLIMQLRPDGPTDTDEGALEPQGFFRQGWLAIK